MVEMSYEKCFGCLHVGMHYKGETKDEVDMPTNSLKLVCRLFKECIYVKGKCPSEGDPEKLGVNCTEL